MLTLSSGVAVLASRPIVQPMLILSLSKERSRMVTTRPLGLSAELVKMLMRLDKKRYIFRLEKIISQQHKKWESKAPTKAE